MQTLLFSIDAMIMNRSSSFRDNNNDLASQKLRLWLSMVLTYYLGNVIFTTQSHQNMQIIFSIASSCIAFYDFGPDPPNNMIWACNCFISHTTQEICCLRAFVGSQTHFYIISLDQTCPKQNSAVSFNPIGSNF